MFTCSAMCKDVCLASCQARPEPPHRPHPAEDARGAQGFALRAELLCVGLLASSIRRLPRAREDARSRTPAVTTSPGQGVAGCGSSCSAAPRRGSGRGSSKGPKFTGKRFIRLHPCLTHAFLTRLTVSPLASHPAATAHAPRGGGCGARPAAGCRRRSGLMPAVSRRDGARRAAPRGTTSTAVLQCRSGSLLQYSTRNGRGKAPGADHRRSRHVRPHSPHRMGRPLQREHSSARSRTHACLGSAL